ncbi:hypothetical protein CEXT_663001 [Caerostris extrusa]|uniref:Uncharacterized protein n=1 Tax=Caerostris extrusa TaxID=172846 RepID=A0AAV4MBH9_CAEEX|nr:hypothetical protein CEXT_663001 [Caerostris extrusa]
MAQVDTLAFFSKVVEANATVGNKKAVQGRCRAVKQSPFMIDLRDSAMHGDINHRCYGDFYATSQCNRVL